MFREIREREVERFGRFNPDKRATATTTASKAEFDPTKRITKFDPDKRV